MLIVAYILQSFSNAVIFRLRNLDKSWFTCSCCYNRNRVEQEGVSTIATTTTVAERVEQGGSQRQQQRLPQISIFVATPSHSPRAHSSGMSASSGSNPAGQESTTTETRMSGSLPLPTTTQNGKRGNTTTQVTHGYQTNSSVSSNCEVEEIPVF